MSLGQGLQSPLVPSGRVMVSPGLLLLLLLLLLPCMLPLASLHTWKTGWHQFHKVPCPSGNARAAVTNSLSPEKFCTPQTVLQKCLPWQKPNGYMCSRHSECQSNCCITNNYGKLLFCTARTIFLQCVPWPQLDYCTYHSECQSKCCLRLNEVSKHRCVPQTGVLVQCLPVVRWGGGGGGMGQGEMGQGEMGQGRWDRGRG
uniref:Leucine rich colipase like 1 n=1 Tax=Sus scrofa TaxID=9823 RepID=A0A4X1UT47_PIG